MNPQNTLCLVLDIQQRLVPAMAESAAFVQRCRQFVMGLAALAVPLYVTEQYPKGLGATVAELADWLTEVPRLEKTQFSACLPELRDYLAAHQIENVLIIGAETHICVLQTAADLRRLGLNVYVPMECVASRTVQNRQNGLDQLTQLGAVVSNVESLLFMLLGDAKHPAFKTISKLIL